jgi:hypothetical protein
LQKAGLIRYSRGFVTVLHIQRLATSACDGCRISKAAFNRVGLAL